MDGIRNKLKPVKKLPETFISGKEDYRVLYTQVDRTATVCLYKCLDWTDDVYYEAFRVKTQPASEMLSPSTGELIKREAKERYPRDEDFGYSAFTSRSRKVITEIYDNLVYENNKQNDI